MRALPHPLAPEQRLVGTRDLGWLILSLTVVVLPHFSRAPWWLVLLTLCLYGWRIYCTLDRGRLPSRWLMLVVAAVAMLGVWVDQRTLFGRNAGIMMLLLFSGLKLMETRNHRDAAVTVFLGYFLIITNLLFTQSIPTAIAMCVSVGMLTVSLIGLSAPHRPMLANLRTSGLILAHAAPAAFILFLLFPRVQGPLWGLPQDAYAGISGLSGTMAPGDFSRLALSDATAFRAEFTGEPPSHRELYWRGPVLWDFDGRTWHMGRQTLGRYEPPKGGGPAYRYGVVLEPHNRQWLFALEAASTLPDRARFTPDGQILAEAPVRSRMRYDLTSIAVTGLRADEHPSLLDRALLLPAKFNPRATALAAQWRDTATSDEDVVQQGIAFLRAGRFTYTLEPPLLGEHSVDEFIFATKAGFCEHFSSAFVFLMRAAGVPARVVTGYQGGDVNPVDRIVTVRQSEAHAWAEVFLRGRGWVRVDPTAATNPMRVDSGLPRAVADADSLPYLIRTDFEWLRRMRYEWEALSHRWNVWVLGYNPDRQRDLLSMVGIPDADWRALTAILFVVLGIMTSALLAWSLRRLTRPDPVQTAWRAFCRKLAAHGLERAPSEGPRDYSARAARALPASRRAILRIGSLYIRLRYGRQFSGARVAELRRLVRGLRLT
jgi:transglutaminase-like putative cysteine protease